VGWLTWPGDAPLKYLQYWYYPIVHPGVIEEQRIYEAETPKETKAVYTKMKARCGTAHTDPFARFVAPGETLSEQLDEFIGLEACLISNREQIGRWIATALVPPAVLFIIGASLLWALRGFRQTS
jgi:hypothetical protein